MFGYSKVPMAAGGKEALDSLGNNAALAVTLEKP
jgi:hypothetical protein